jgi:glycosyltransferase involved in cell wall biosynthesis
MMRFHGGWTPSVPPEATSTSRPTKIWVVTCAHRGDDARILHRQIRSLLAAGCNVTLVAPTPPVASQAADPERLCRVTVPRARGRRRLRAHLAVIQALRKAQRANDVDLVIVHDPELVLWVIAVTWRSQVPIVWDVHEDFVASVADRTYLPRWLRPILTRVLLTIERIAIRRCHLILAEDSYQDRLGQHLVVSNATWIPEQSDLPEGLRRSQSGLVRVLYAGRISTSRGVVEMIEIARQLAGIAELHLIGEPDADVADLVAEAAAAGIVTWHGYLPNPDAMAEIPGALAGLSLLHDLPNYRGSRPTKLIEYLAHQVPVISTDLPVAAQLVSDSGGGTVVRWDHVVADTVAQITQWASDPEAARAQGRSGYQFVRNQHSWQAEADRFVDHIRALAH